jgi:hypothetical protein
MQRAWGLVLEGSAHSNNRQPARVTRMRRGDTGKGPPRRNRSAPDFTGGGNGPANITVSSSASFTRAGGFGGLTRLLDHIRALASADLLSRPRTW